MNKTLLGVALALAVAVPPAHAQCTQEQLQAKATELTKRIQELAAKDAQRAQAWSAKIQEASLKLQEALKQPGAGIDAVCRYYDALLAELDKV